MRSMDRLRNLPACVLLISLVTVLSTISVLITAYLIESGCAVSHDDCNYETLASVQSHAMMLFPNQLFLAIDDDVALPVRMVIQVLVSAIFLFVMGRMNVRRWHSQILVLVIYLALSFAATVGALAIAFAG